MKITEWTLAERPRERLAERGAESLGNAELLAILLRTGTREKNVVDIGHELLQMTEGSLTRLSVLDVRDLRAVGGIGPDKAVTLKAAFELGRRLVEEASSLENITITHPRMVYRLMIPRLKGLTHEECWVLYLNRANYVVHKERLSIGSTDATPVDQDTLLHHAIERRCRAVILIHNHPSGNPAPGKSDYQETGRLRGALGALGIDLMDHVIISDDRFYSFADEQVYLSGD